VKAPMGKLALVFPGQGSQSVGMGRELVQAYEAAARVYDRAGELLGWDVGGLSFNGDEEELSRTDRAQVALFVNSAAVTAVLRQEGVSADVVSGHSLGEYGALEAAGALDFDRCLELVAFRGEVMNEEACERPGAMAAIIGLADSEVEDICDRTGGVWPVNYNSPGQLVISGERPSVAAAMELAEERGAKRAIALRVSGAFHSPLMRRAAERMEHELATAGFNEPEPPFLSSTSCEYEPAAGLADLLARQIVSPVRWTSAVERMIADGVTRFVEVGNGKVLCGLVRRIDRDVDTLATGSPEGIKKSLAAIEKSLE